MAGKGKVARSTTAAGKKQTSTAETTVAATPPEVAAAEPAAAAGKLSAMAAAAKVLAEAGTALTCKELVGVMAAKGYWASPGGKTPEATLHAAISTEIKKKGDAARFRKAAPGRFAATTGAPAKSLRPRGGQSAHPTPPVERP